MKKTLFALAALLLLAGCSNKEENHGDTNTHITGTVKGFKKGRLFLTRINDTAAVVLDTIIIDGTSSFETHLKLDSPEMLYLVIDRVSSNSVDDNLRFFAEPGNIKIQTSLEGFFSNAKITGSKNQEVYETYLAQRKRINDKNLDLVKDEFDARSKKNSAAMIDSIQQKKKRITARLYLDTANFAVNNGKYEVAPYLAVTEIANINIKYLDTIQKRLTPQVSKSLYGKQLTKLIARRKKEEATAPVVVPAAK
jgi:hypothetical protein